LNIFYLNNNHHNIKVVVLF